MIVLDKNHHLGNFMTEVVEIFQKKNVWLVVVLTEKLED